MFTATKKLINNKNSWEKPKHLFFKRTAKRCPFNLKPLVFKVKYSAHAECEIISFGNYEILLIVVAMWNEIKPLTRSAHFTREAYFVHEVHFTNPARDLFRWKKHTFVYQDNVCFFLEYPARIELTFTASEAIVLSVKLRV